VASFANVKTMGGSITIDHADAPVDATTMGGNVTVNYASASVKTTTMGGEIQIKRAAGSVLASSLGGDVTAHLEDSSSAPRTVELTSKGGTITLFVPQDFPMEIHVTLAYTDKANRSYHIIDEVGLTQHSTSEWDSSQGSPRKYIYGDGRIGNGQNHVVIKTVNGDVLIKREKAS
jgi:DUF4097 and DUF4098 domain-containing protein YvlB